MILGYAVLFSLAPVLKILDHAEGMGQVSFGDKAPRNLFDQRG